MAGPFSGLAPASPGELSLFVLGSGFGESSVIVTPSGRVLVADVCVDGEKHLTSALLDELGLDRIDLLVVTHADLDHVRGLPALLAGRNVGEAWRFPAAADVRVLAAKWLRGAKDDRRLVELHDAMKALDALAATNQCVYGGSDVRPWSPGGADPVRVECLAPSQHDQRRAGAQLDDLVTVDVRGVRLAENIERFFNRATRKLGAPPNVLSLAASVSWDEADVRVVLGGDVERGDGTEWSGWRGILSTLTRRGQRDLVRGARAVKVAHHGSRGAHEDDAWDDHTRTQPEETWALVAPFWHGAVELPNPEPLRDLGARGVRLGLCEASRARRLALQAGWVEDVDVDEVCDGPVMVLRWGDDGACTPTRGRRAAAFRASK
jgi:hypothetical protein